MNTGTRIEVRFTATPRLTESQINCLGGLWLGSKGVGSNKRTLDSLLRHGLATVFYHQGEHVWEVTERGAALASSALSPETADDLTDKGWI